MASSSFITTQATLDYASSSLWFVETYTASNWKVGISNAPVALSGPSTYSVTVVYPTLSSSRYIYTVAVQPSGGSTTNITAKFAIAPTTGTISGNYVFQQLVVFHTGTSVSGGGTYSCMSTIASFGISGVA
jgi:hypothetical protein